MIKRKQPVSVDLLGIEQGWCARDEALLQTLEILSRLAPDLAKGPPRRDDLDEPSAILATGTARLALWAPPAPSDTGLSPAKEVQLESGRFGGLWGVIAEGHDIWKEMKALKPVWSTLIPMSTVEVATDGIWFADAPNGDEGGFEWTDMRNLSMLAPGQFHFQVLNPETGENVSFALQSDWSELAFGYCTMLTRMSLPQAADGSWIRYDELLARANRQGRALPPDPLRSDTSR